jgi:hypothetical protein
VLASAPNLGHGFLGGEGQDVGAGNLVPAPRVAVHGGLGVHDRLEPLRLQRLVVGVPPLVVAVRVHDQDRRVAALIVIKSNQMLYVLSKVHHRMAQPTTHTLTAQSWKKSLSTAGPEMVDCAMDCFTELRTMACRLGQVLA